MRRRVTQGPGLAELPGGRLRAGESWRYQPAIDQTVGWVSVSTGRLRVPGSVDAGELVIFEPSIDAIDFYADADTEFVLGSAAPHGDDLVLGQSSVHSSPAMLRAGEQRQGDPAPVTERRPTLRLRAAPATRTNHTNTRRSVP